MSAHDHIVLTSHPPVGGSGQSAISWGAADPSERGPVIGTVTDPAMRNTIGTHSGSYSVYLAASVAAGHLDPDFKPDLHNTMPVANIGPYPQWSDPGKIVSLDPFGHMITFGRVPNNDIVISLPSVSKIHGYLHKDAEGNWWIYDQRSTNGTWLNRVRVPAGQRRTKTSRVR